MLYQEHLLTVRYIPTKTNTLKLFTLFSPVNLNDFPPLILYRELSLLDEQFATDVLMALKEPKKGRQVFIARLIKYWKSLPTVIDGEVLLTSASHFLNRIEQELILFNLYQTGLLPFNSLWFEGPDTLVFFRVDKNDVE